MGQKVNPIGLRIGINKTWNSRWYAKGRDYTKWLHEDLKIHEYFKKLADQAQIDRVDIERQSGNRIKVIVKCARPGVLIGKKRAGLDKIEEDLRKLLGKDKKILVVAKEVEKPLTSATLIARNIARQIEKRIPYKRAMKRAILRARQAGALGIKIRCAGRLGGAEIARAEWYIDGRVPLTTLRADIDYGFDVALTKYGTIGVKVWVFKGEILDDNLDAFYKKQVEGKE